MVLQRKPFHSTLNFLFLISHTSHILFTSRYEYLLLFVLCVACLLFPPIHICNFFFMVVSYTDFDLSILFHIDHYYHHYHHYRNQYYYRYDHPHAVILYYFLTYIILSHFLLDVYRHLHLTFHA